MQICKNCGEEKPLNEFTKDKRRKLGVGSWCKKCHNSRHWKNKDKNNAKCKLHYLNNKQQYKEYRRFKNYGVTPDQFNALFEEQRGGCAICSVLLANDKTTCVDHCHTTGKVRGLLCSNCNFALGHFKDSITLIQSAIRYLEGRQL